MNVKFARKTQSWPHNVAYSVERLLRDVCVCVRGGGG